MSVKREPLYSCDGSEECASSCSFPANMLRIHNDKLICQECWESPWLFDSDDKTLWGDLPEFVPEDKRRIAALEQAARRAYDAIEEYQYSFDPPPPLPFCKEINELERIVSGGKA